jgi:hypothetical protein
MIRRRASAACAPPLVETRVARKLADHRSLAFTGSQVPVKTGRALLIALAISVLVCLIGLGFSHNLIEEAFAAQLAHDPANHGGDQIGECVSSLDLLGERRIFRSGTGWQLNAQSSPRGMSHSGRGLLAA